jgi:hypothetical protein
MPDLSFRVEGVEPVPRALTPLLALKLHITNAVADEQIHSILLRCQVQVEAPRRRHSSAEQTALFDLFGPPEDWGKTLKTMPWAQVSAGVGGFTGSTAVDLQVPCTYDLNVASARYFHSLEGGEIPLRLLFSGTVFHAGPRGPLQVAQIPWDREATYRLPVRAWQETMDHYFPGSAWIRLRKDLVGRLGEYKTRGGFPTWDQAVQSLLESSYVEEH